MNSIKCIKTRRSIRAYLDKPIPSEIMEDVLDCARLAPSANNAQKWKFYVITDKKKLQELSKQIMWGKFLRDASACIIVTGETGYSHLVEDCGAATQNILLSAHAHGIGTCWIAGYKRNYDSHVRDVVGIGKEVELFSIVSMGYPKVQPEAHGKKELKNIVLFD